VKNTVRVLELLSGAATFLRIVRTRNPPLTAHQFV